MRMQIPGRFLSRNWYEAKFPEVFLALHYSSAENRNDSMMLLVKCVVVGALVLSMLNLMKADIWPGQRIYDEICLEIINDAAADSIPFRKLTTCFVWWGIPIKCLQVHEITSREDLCKRLIQQHNSYNSLSLEVGESAVSGSGQENTASEELPTISFIDMSVTTTECLAAFRSPTRYGVHEWNKWSGRHCGTWWSTDDDTEYTINALWSSPFNSAKVGFLRQDVLFDRPGECCDDSWNESGGNVSYTINSLLLIHIFLFCIGGGCLGMGSKGGYKPFWLPRLLCWLALHISLWS